MSHQPDGRPLGKWLTAALVVGNMIGAGVFMFPSALAEEGGTSPFGWLVIAGGVTALTIVFARLAGAHPRTGGPYAYSRLAFGDFAGFTTAWAYWIAIWAGNAALAIAFAAHVGVFLPAVADYPLLTTAVALGAIWILTWVNGLGIRQGGVVQGATTVLKAVPLIAIAAFGLGSIDVERLESVATRAEFDLGSLALVGALSLWLFVGLESATIPTDVIDRPTTRIPRATIWGTIVVAVLYVLGTAAVIGTVPTDTLAGSSAPFADAAELAIGAWARDLVAAGAVIAVLGALNGWILLQGHIPMAAARDQLFPVSFARTTAGGVPIVGLVVSSALTTALVVVGRSEGLAGAYTAILLLAGVAVFFVYAVSAASQVVLISQDRTLVDTRRLVGHVGIAAVALVFAGAAIVGAGADAAYGAALMFLAGIPVHLYVQWTRVRGPLRIKVPDTPEALFQDAHVSPMRDPGRDDT